MKKILFMLALALLPFLSNAQFKVTKDCFLTEEGKDFYVTQVEGKNAMDLYKGVRAYILSNYRNPDIVSNEIEGEMINLHFIDDRAFPISYGLGVKISAEIDMNIIMRFKDGKIRFDSPSMNRMHTPGSMANKEMDYVFSGGTGKFVGKTSLYNKKGSPKDKKIIKSLEDYVNQIINKITESASGKTNEDW